MARRRTAKTLHERIGDRVRALREEAGLSQMDMVRDHKWSLSHLGKVERGVTDARISTLARLAEDLGVTLSQLLDEV